MGEANTAYKGASREYEIADQQGEEKFLLALLVNRNLFRVLEERINDLKAARFELEAAMLRLETMAVTLEDGAIAHNVSKLTAEYRRLLNENQ
jgi:hypothetical protein